MPWLAPRRMQPARQRRSRRAKRAANGRKPAMAHQPWAAGGLARPSVHRMQVPPSRAVLHFRGALCTASDGTDAWFEHHPSREENRLQIVQETQTERRSARCARVRDSSPVPPPRPGPRSIDAEGQAGPCLKQRRGTPSTSRRAFSMNSNGRSRGDTSRLGHERTPARPPPGTRGCRKRAWRMMRSWKRQLAVRPRADAEVVAEVPVVEVVAAGGPDRA